MIHTKIVYQDLDIEALNKANDEKKNVWRTGQLFRTYQKFQKKEGYKRIK